MKFNFNKIIASLFMTATALALVTSCNKDVQGPTPIKISEPVGKSILDSINNESSLTILKAAIARASTNSTFGNSLSALLGDRNGVFTIFAPTDIAFQLSGIPSVAAIATLRPGFLDTVLRYHIVGGRALTAAEIPSTFPNLQLPTQLVLSAPSATLPPGLRMSIFPSKRGTSLWANNIPLTQIDIRLANGILHKTQALVAPPSTTIKGILASNPTKYSLLLEAIKRADSGQIAGLNRLDSVINFAAANVTLFAPNNDAFRAMFPAGTPDAAIINALNTPAMFTAEVVRGLIAYHLLGSRAFSVNFAAGPAPVNTQLVLPTTPPTVVPVIVTYGGVNFTVKGMATGSTDVSILTRDQHAINGVVHEINQVLRPR